MNYKITISLLNESNLVLTKDVPYYGSQGNKDIIQFDKHSITIMADRNRRYNENSIFLNVQNSLYNQVLKSLIIHYCFNGNKAGISEIKVEIKEKKSYAILCNRTFDDNTQPFPSFDSPIPFKIESLKVVLDEDDSSFVLRIVLLHWLGQGKTTDRLHKLESIWRTFERLCDYMRHSSLGDRSNISQGLDLMINELTNNPISYNSSASYVNAETISSLRKYRWREMIENNFPKTIVKPDKVLSTYNTYKKRLIDPFVDERVCSLMKELLAYRNTELHSCGLFNSIDVKLNANISSHFKKDIDIVALLCYYAYYLRNRLFHGQSLIRESIFDLNHSDDMQIERITTLLSILIIEIVNNFKSL